MSRSFIFGSLNLRKTFSLDFVVNCNFSKIRIEHVKLKFLLTMEKISYSQFTIHNSNESRAVLFVAGDRIIASERRELG